MYKDKEKERQHKKEYYLKNKKKIREKHKVYYLKNKESYVIRANQWKKNNPNKVKEYSKQYHLKNPKAGIMWQKKRFNEILDKKGKMCAYCGNTNTVVLQIHHKKGKDRKRDWMKKNYNLERIEIVCANCHMIIHYKTNKYSVNY